jgi:DNA-binding transcriptional regulator YiaG
MDRKKLERKKVKEFEYKGFGFPVTFVNVPVVLAHGVWTPDINYNKVMEQVLVALAMKPARLTGNEIRFIRHSLKMNLAQFGKRLGVTHPAVMKWEKTGDRPTGMNWGSEKDLRLEIVKARLKPEKFVSAFDELTPLPPEEGAPLALELCESA